MELALRSIKYFILQSGYAKKIHGYMENSHKRLEYFILHAKQTNKQIENARSQKKLLNTT